MRFRTFDLRLGIGRLRWQDTMHDVRNHYPASHPTKARRWYDNEKGRIEHLPPGLVIGNFISVTDELVIAAHPRFDARGVKQVTLLSYPACDASTWSDKQWLLWPLLVQRAAMALGKKLGLSVQDGVFQQFWMVDQIRIELTMEADSFSFTIQAPRRQFVRKNDYVDRLRSLWKPSFSTSHNLT